MFQQLISENMSWYQESIVVTEACRFSSLSPRVGHSICVLDSDKHTFLLFGGASHEQGPLQDLWLIDVGKVHINVNADTMDIFMYNY